MEPVTGDIWYYCDIGDKNARHYIFHDKIKNLNEETQTWYALCLETGEYKQFYWFTSSRWSKVA